jgi:SNF2 family DNA or RNA helicase
VIAPLRVAEDTWSTEAQKWDHTKHLKIAKVLGSAKERKAALQEEADIYVINRENVPWLIEQHGEIKSKVFKFTKRWPFDMVVIDELSSFKSQSAVRFKMLKKARPFIKRIVGLTGTPAPNGLLDLWPQVYLLDSGERLGKTMTAYRERYFKPAGYIKTPQGMLVASSYAPKEGSEQAIYDKLGDLCISMKSEDWLDLPERLDRVVDITLKPETMKQYKELEKELVLELDPEIIDAGSAAAVTGKLQQFSQGAIYIDEHHNYKELHQEKLEALDELIEEANGKPVLVFYWYKHDAIRLITRYKDARTLDTSKDIKDWNDGKIKLLLAHPASAGHGLNLQAGGNIIIWFSLTWSLELYQQANARLHRQGQTQSVIIHHLITKGTVDENIMASLSGKAEGQNALMDAVKAIVKKFS